jgi:hypothetical protein
LGNEARFWRDQRSRQVETEQYLAKLAGSNHRAEGPEKPDIGSPSPPPGDGEGTGTNAIDHVEYSITSHRGDGSHYDA